VARRHILLAAAVQTTRTIFASTAAQAAVTVKVQSGEATIGKSAHKPYFCSVFLTLLMLDFSVVIDERVVLFSQLKFHFQ